MSVTVHGHSPDDLAPDTSTPDTGDQAETHALAEAARVLADHLGGTVQITGAAYVMGAGSDTDALTVTVCRS